MAIRDSFTFFTPASILPSFPEEAGFLSGSGRLTYLRGFALTHLAISSNAIRRPIAKRPLLVGVKLPSCTYHISLGRLSYLS